MNILITGANGFIGKNLAAALEGIRLGHDKTRPALKIDELYLCDADTPVGELSSCIKNADFVFHLAGVNRPKQDSDFIKVNFDFSAWLLGELERAGNACAVMLASSVQVSLTGRFSGSEYGMSKRACEQAFFAHAKATGARALVYRFPNVFGKWSKPEYNSVVATFCHNASRALELRVDSPDAELELLYIDDLIAELLDALEGKEHRCTFFGATPTPDESGEYCFAPITHKATVGELAKLISSFSAPRGAFIPPELPEGSFIKKLYSTYVSFLPENEIVLPLTTVSDARGDFTELIKTADSGQLSLNRIRPGVVKGQHWHNSKLELFIVVSGRALIRQRRVGEERVIETVASGEELKAVRILPGYTHSIENVSDSKELVVIIWANEPFDPDRPDTFYMEV